MSDSLIYYATKLFPKVENTLNISNDFFKCFHYGFFARPCVIDRMNVVNKYSNLRVTTKYPYVFAQHSSFEKTCLYVAENVLKDSNKEILILLSGIDSLVALCSFLHVNSDYGNTINVIYNKELDKLAVKNILPSLHRRFLFHSEYIDYTSTFSYLSSVENKLIVTGEMGDQLIGSLFCFLYPELINLYWKDGLVEYIAKNRIIREYNLHLSLDTIVDVSSISLRRSLFYVETFFDYLKWINFNFIFDYDCNKYDFLEKNNSVFHFFASPLLQSWSIEYHPQARLLSTPSQYKLIYKKFIQRISCEPTSLMLTKSPSCSGNLRQTKRDSIIAIDNEHNFVYNNQIGLLMIKRFFNNG